MKKIKYYLATVFLLSLSACSEDNFNRPRILIPEFGFENTFAFEEKISDYRIFKEDINNLDYNENFHLFELSSELFTDYAYKQRLIKLPIGYSIQKLEDGTLKFPNGTMLTKTFYYYNDERDINLGKIIIETRLLVKENESWNIATYVWNDEQTDAFIHTEGLETQVTWTNKNGVNNSIFYSVPKENDCMACHQSNSKITPIGPTLLNLNRDIDRDSITINQIKYFQNAGIIGGFPLNQIPRISNYKDNQESLKDRGRAYLALNCAHCHNPNAWDVPANIDLDLRFETELSQTGILDNKNKIIRNITENEMPFIGTTIMDEEGVNLVNQYINGI